MSSAQCQTTIIRRQNVKFRDEIRSKVSKRRRRLFADCKRNYNTRPPMLPVEVNPHAYGKAPYMQYV